MNNWIEAEITRWAKHYARPEINRADVGFMIQELTTVCDCPMNSRTIQEAVHEVVQYETAIL